MRGFMTSLLICSASMSAIALFYIAVTPLLSKRYSGKWLYYTWLVVVIGFIIPFRPYFDNAIVKIDLPTEAAVPLVLFGSEAPSAAYAEKIADNTAFRTVLPDVSLWQALAVIWLAGVIVFLARHAVRHLRFTKLAARWSEGVADEQTLALLEGLKAEMGISKRIGLQLCASVGSPMMIGFISPRILLPKEDFARDELRFVLRHELVHYKRGDIWYKGLVLIATAMHWFNPLVRVMAKEIGTQCELSCDNEVVRSMDAEARQRYGETIIAAAQFQSRLKTALSTNFYGGKNDMKKRILSVMDTSKKNAGIVLLCAALIISLGTGMVFAVAEAVPGEAEEAPHQLEAAESNIYTWDEDGILEELEVENLKVYACDENGTLQEVELKDADWEWYTYAEYKEAAGLSDLSKRILFGIEHGLLQVSKPVDIGDGSITTVMVGEYSLYEFESFGFTEGE